LESVFDQDSAVRHMLGLFAAEARNLGHTLTESDLDLLARQCPLPPVLELEAKEVITQLLAKEELEAEADDCEDPRSFSNTLEWANEPMYPNIARLTEDVISGKTREAKLHAWPRVLDTVLLVLSALGVVILMMVVGYFFSK
jgi:TusA-related sulfurtransferase